MGLLSDITVYTKYSNFNEKLGRRENWSEIVERYLQMMIDRFPQLEKEIKQYGEYIHNKSVLPSMRALQFAGKAIEKTNSRLFNCAYTVVDCSDVFGEIMFLLLGGSGVGFSVQNRHISKLPIITKQKYKQRYLITDNIAGWGDAVKTIIKSYFGEIDYYPVFDGRDIRPKGDKLSSGGKAPGYEPLKKVLENLDKILNNAIGRKLTDLEVHDIVCHIANGVLAGGIRRAALISLFDKDSEAMLNCKAGNWWEKNEQRGRANNSAVLHRDFTTKEEFEYVYNKCKNSYSGEPGFAWTNDYDIGFNPCAEIALNPNQFCNLTTINVSNLKDENDYLNRCLAATFFGTLQASFTDFYYLRPVWKQTTEKESLLGVSMTGIANCDLSKFDLKNIVKLMKELNSHFASLIGINPAARLNCIKPEGTTSCVLESPSGIHAEFAKFWLRTMRFNNDEAIVNYIKYFIPEIVEPEIYNPDKTSCVRIPMKANESAILRDNESALQLLERVKFVSENWIKPGHNSGLNTHNCSVTVSIKDNEWDEVMEWMWDNKEYYNGISLLPYDGGSYKQAPFEEINEETYNKYMNYMKQLDMDKIDDKTTIDFIQDSVACAGGACVI